MIITDRWTLMMYNHEAPRLFDGLEEKGLVRMDRRWKTSTEEDLEGLDIVEVQYYDKQKHKYEVLPLRFIRFVKIEGKWTVEK